MLTMTCDIQLKIEDDLVKKQLVDNDMKFPDSKMWKVREYHSNLVSIAKQKYSFPYSKIFSLEKVYGTMDMRVVFNNDAINFLQDKKDMERERDRIDMEQSLIEYDAQKRVDEEILQANNLPIIKITC